MCLCVHTCVVLMEIYCAVSVCACDVVEVHCCSTVEYETGQTEEQLHDKQLQRCARVSD